MSRYNEQIEAARRSGAPSLNLSGRMLDTLPESLRDLTTLTELNLTGNQLSVLPDWIGDLTALTRLALGGNRLTVLPDSLGTLAELTWLGLSGNRLSVLPESLGDLTALRWLDLTGNRLSTLPDRIGDLTALTRLDLAGNRLTTLPDRIGDLTALTRLDLARNHLTALPASLTDLDALTRLDLAGNPLATWPEPPAHRAGEPAVHAPLHAWIDGTRTTVASAADLDIVLDRVRRGSVTLASDDDARTLFINLDGDRSALVWEADSDILLGWGPVPAGAPGGQVVSDVEYAVSDPWFAGEPDLTEAQARQAGHQFLRTGRRPTTVQWIDKP